jgi:tetratricopeptide (TPR) repeat protein
MGRHDAALEAADRACALAPESLFGVGHKTFVLLAQGDLEGTRAFLRLAAERVDVTELVATIAVDLDRYWVLDEEWQDLLLRLGPEPFAGAEADRQIACAHVLFMRGDVEQARVHAELAAAAFAVMLDQAPDAVFPTAVMGAAQAYLGHRDEALGYGRRAVELATSSHGKLTNAYARLQLIRIHLILGDTEAALDLIEPLAEEPWPFTSPGWLSIEPMYDPVRDSPRFQALLERESTPRQ